MSIKIKYSLVKDLLEIYDTWSDRRVIRENDILTVSFSWRRVWRYLTTIPATFLLRPYIQWLDLTGVAGDGEYICYLLSSGTEGRYYAGTNAIGICPEFIQSTKQLQEVMVEEITHLKHPEFDSLPHAEKEARIAQLLKP